MNSQTIMYSEPMECGTYTRWSGLISGPSHSLIRQVTKSPEPSSVKPAACSHSDMK